MHVRDVRASVAWRACQACISSGWPLNTSVPARHIREVSTRFSRPKGSSDQELGLLDEEVPAVPVLLARLEDAELPEGSFDSVVAATSMHWVNLSIGLPKVHAALREGGLLAVWRNRFGDDSVSTEFRRRVEQIVARRGPRGTGAPRADDRPVMEELAAGGWFELVRTEHWRWSIDLKTDQVRRLFRTFSDWTDDEVEAVAQAAEELGGEVTEHYRSVLHVLRKARLVAEI